MKKSINKAIAHLKNFVGQKMIRTRTTEKVGDWSYITDYIVLVGFTQDGCIKYIDPRLDDKVKVLPLDFTDRNWIPLKKASNQREIL